MDVLTDDRNRNELLRHSGTILEKRANIAIWGLILVIMVSVGRIQEIIPALVALKLGKVSFGLAIVLYFVSPKQSEIKFFSTSQIKYIVALFLLGLVSTPFSFWPGQSFNFMVFLFSYSLVLFFLLIKVATTNSDLKIIVWGGGISIVLHGLKALMSGVERASAGGGSYDPNDLAFVLVLFLPLFYFSMKNERGMPRLFMASFLIISLAAIMATQSRGGFLGLLAVLLGIAICEKINIVKMVFGSGVLLLVFLIISPTGYVDRMSTMLSPEQDYNRTESGGRIEIWKRGIQLMMENPVLGVGPAAFEVAEATKHTDVVTGISGKWSVAHNSFVQIGTELGIPGLVLFIMILVLSIRSLRRLRRELPEDSELRWLVNALEVSFYGYIVSGFFLSQAYSAALYLLLGLTVAVVNMSERERKDLLRMKSNVILQAQ